MVVMVDYFDDRAQLTILGCGADEDGTEGSESPIETFDSSALDGISGRPLFAAIYEMGVDNDDIASSLSGTISLRNGFGGIATSILTEISNGCTSFGSSTISGTSSSFWRLMEQIPDV